MHAAPREHVAEAVLRHRQRAGPAMRAAWTRLTHYDQLSVGQPARKFIERRCILDEWTCPHREGEGAH